MRVQHTVSTHRNAVTEDVLTNQNRLDSCLKLGVMTYSEGSRGETNSASSIACMHEQWHSTRNTGQLEHYVMPI